MSHVSLLAAGKKLPTYVSKELYTFTNGPVSMTKEFAVTENTYYGCAVAELGLEMKPHQMELYWEERSPEELECLRRYLRENFSPGEEVELWSLWVGNHEQHVSRYRVSFAEFGMETVGLLRTANIKLREGAVIPKGKPVKNSDWIAEQVCVTIEF